MTIFNSYVKLPEGNQCFMASKKPVSCRCEDFLQAPGSASWQFPKTPRCPSPSLPALPAQKWRNAKPTAQKKNNLKNLVGLKVRPIMPSQLLGQKTLRSQRCPKTYRQNQVEQSHNCQNTLLIFLKIQGVTKGS